MAFQKRRRRQLLWVYAALAAIGYGLLRILLLRHRWFDLDELEHLHAAICVSHGLVLYRDFFELHGPLLYFLLAPFTLLSRDPLFSLWAGRTLMLVFFLGTLAAQGWLFPKGTRPALRVLALILLCSFTTFANKSLEIRPDVPAMLALTVAIAGAMRARRRWHFFALGICLGVAFLFSFKTVYGAVGLLMGLSLHRWRDQGPIHRRFAWPLGAVAMGGVAVGLATVTYFWAHDALRNLFGCLVVVNSRFTQGWLPTVALWESLRANTWVWGLGLLGLAHFKRHPLAGCALLGAALGIVFCPSTYPQYYLFVAPVLCVFAAEAAWTIKRECRRRWPRGGIALWLAGMGIGLAFPFMIQINMLSHTNDRQLARMRCLLAETNPSDRVFDVWSGEAFFRPHASYFWFFPPDVYAVIRPEWRERQLLKGLSDPRCRVVLWANEYVAQLPPSITAYIHSHFHPSPCPYLLLRN